MKRYYKKWRMREVSGRGRRCRKGKSLESQMLAKMVFGRGSVQKGTKKVHRRHEQEHRVSGEYAGGVAGRSGHTIGSGLVEVTPGHLVLKDWPATVGWFPMARR